MKWTLNWRLPAAVGWWGPWSNISMTVDMEKGLQNVFSLPSTWGIPRFKPYAVLLVIWKCTVIYLDSNRDNTKNFQLSAVKIEDSSSLFVQSGGFKLKEFWAEKDTHGMNSSTVSSSRCDVNDNSNVSRTGIEEEIGEAKSSSELRNHTWELHRETSDITWSLWYLTKSTLYITKDALKLFMLSIPRHILNLIPPDSNIIFVGDSRIRQIFKGMRNFCLLYTSPSPRD